MHRAVEADPRRWHVGVAQPGCVRLAFVSENVVLVDDDQSGRVSTLGEGASAGTVAQASAADIVVIAVPWGRVAEAVQGISWRGQVVIDATNDFDPSDLDGRTSSELVADLVAGARVVKAANTLAAEVLGSDPHVIGGDRVIFLSGNDSDAKSEVISLFQDAGFSAIDLGDLATGGRMQQVHGPLAGVDLIRVHDSTGT